MLWLGMTLLLALVGKNICSENSVLQDSLRTGDEKVLMMSAGELFSKR